MGQQPMSEVGWCPWFHEWGVLDTVNAEDIHLCRTGVLCTQPNNRAPLPEHWLTKAGICFLSDASLQALCGPQKTFSLLTYERPCYCHLPGADSHLPCLKMTRKTLWPASYQHFICGDHTAHRNWGKKCMVKTGLFPSQSPPHSRKSIEAWLWRRLWSHGTVP